MTVRTLYPRLLMISVEILGREGKGLKIDGKPLCQKTWIFKGVSVIKCKWNFLENPASDISHDHQ